MKIVAKSDWVIVKEYRPPKTKSGLWLPDVTDDPAKRAQTGTVVAVGPGTRNARGTFLETVSRTGERILMNQYTTSEIYYEGQKYLAVRDGDILAKIEDADW